MVAGVSVVVWFCVLTTVRAVNVAPATAVSSSYAGQVQMLQSIIQMLIAKQQPTVQSPSSGELLAIKTQLVDLETKQGVMETKLRATETKLEATEAELKATRAKFNRKTGSTFIHWGRKTCSNTTELVYSGVAGGSWWDHPGAAANRLCLSLKPETDGTPVPAHYGLLYGAEYDNIPTHYNHDVPCSVCRVRQSTTTIMIPATRTCPKGWTTQYQGHLSTGNPYHKAASEYLCLDKDLENASSGAQNEEGALFYPTFTVGGSLPCPPYGNKKIVFCVVCSK